MLEQFEKLSKHAAKSGVGYERVCAYGVDVFRRCQSLLGGHVRLNAFYYESSNIENRFLDKNSA